MSFEEIVGSYLYFISDLVSLAKLVPKWIDLGLLLGFLVVIGIGRLFCLEKMSSLCCPVVKRPPTSCETGGGM